MVSLLSFLSPTVKYDESGTQAKIEQYTFTVLMSPALTFYVKEGGPIKIVMASRRLVHNGYIACSHCH